MIATHLSYRDRAPLCKVIVAKQLLEVMESKQTNLAVSADVTSAEALLTLADKLGPAICVLKTHIDIIDDFTPALTTALTALARKHQFFIFEDRKFADIGNTVKHQYYGGIFRIADWADMTNAHALPGPGIVEGLAEAAGTKNRGLILLAEMSSAGHLMDAEYIKKTLVMAEQYPEFVFGFIAQHALSTDPRWLYLTPGVKLDAGSDTLGQQYNTPASAIAKGADIIIVGRGIIAAKDPLTEANRYRDAGWKAYLKRIG